MSFFTNTVTSHIRILVKCVSCVFVVIGNELKAVPAFESVFASGAIW